DVSRKRVQVISAPISAELKYSALSYCWGSSKFLKLKKENLDDFESGKVNFAELPRTFTDAVEVTRKLGLQYIWIDALCIVQDDQTDWSLQASQMRDIYSNSVVTLAAISGMSSASGLFFDRAGGRHIEPTPLNLDHDLDHHRWHTRAWTFQEYVLSRRTIHFGAESIQWECQAPSFGVNKLHAQLTSSTNTLGNQLLSKARGMFLWAKIMLEYTNRELTFESDRLPAIAGVARLFHHQLGTYYCGLWEEEFPRHLLWFSDRSKHTSHHYRAVTWRAPSWSWASLSGPVK
ncbi:HET-domain-containing protein, partial [Polyplosphaeria fusca]